MPVRSLPVVKHLDSPTETVFYLLLNLDRWREIEYGLQGEYVARRYLDQGGVICFEELKSGKRVAVVKVLHAEKPVYVKYEVVFEGHQQPFVVHLHLEGRNTRTTDLRVRVETDALPLLQLLRERKLRDVPRLNRFYQDLVLGLKRAGRYHTAIQEARRESDEEEQRRVADKECFERIRGLQFFLDHAQTLQDLALRYSSFYDSNPFRVWTWLQQFSDQERPIALKVAENVRFYSPDRIAELTRSLVARMTILDTLHEGRTPLFVPMGDLGKSGAHLAYEFAKQCRTGTVGTMEDIAPDGTVLNGKVRRAVDSIVFFDDFLATGDQVCKAWPSLSKNVERLGLPCSYAVLVGFDEGYKRVTRETGMDVLVADHLTGADSVFSDEFTLLSKKEVETLKRMCGYASVNNPFGYGHVGSLVVFYYNTPNNTISILRSIPGEGKYFGLFPRRRTGTYGEP